MTVADWTVTHRTQPTVHKEVRVFRRTKAIVGLDIGSSAVKAVELKPAGKGFRVARLALLDHP